MSLFTHTGFSGLWLPLVSPLRDGKPDVEAACALARRYRDAGVSGLVLFGSTGEGHLLSPGEKSAMLHGIQEDPAALPIVIGAGGVDTESVAATVRRLEREDIAGYLVPPPYYLGPSQEGIVWHYRQVANATGRPIIVYDVPKRTGVALTLQTIEALARIPQVAAVKECNPALLHTLDRRRPLQVLCGDDESFLDHFLAGGDGAITASAHIRPDLFLTVMHLARAGDAASARAVFDPLRPLIRLLFAESNPAPLKRALALQRLVADELRLPMTPASGELGQKLRHHLYRLREIEAPSCLRELRPA